MDENSILYWTHMSTYEKCGQYFLWRYGWGDIDLGHGPGKRKTPPGRMSEHSAIMGRVVQNAIEHLYNDELYVDPKNLSARLLAFVEREWVRQENKPGTFIDFSDAKMSRAEMLQTCRDGVLGFLATMKAHRLLGPYAKAEVQLTGWIEKWTQIGGWADTIIRRDDTGITILDGKNTKHKMKYTDPDQLRFYALAFFLSYKVMPDRLGFVWYRFPHGMQTTTEEGEFITETGVEWVPFTREDLQGIAKRAVDARNGMRRKKFEANPVPSECKWCEFETVCPERQAQRAANAGKRSTPQVPEIEQSEYGFVDFS